MKRLLVFVATVSFLLFPQLSFPNIQEEQVRTVDFRFEVRTARDNSVLFIFDGFVGDPEPAFQELQFTVVMRTERGGDVVVSIASSKTLVHHKEFLLSNPEGLSIVKFIVNAHRNSDNGGQEYYFATLRPPAPVFLSPGLIVAATGSSRGGDLDGDGSWIEVEQAEEQEWRFVPDCLDSDFQVNPHTMLHRPVAGGNGFDFNCDGEEEPRYLTLCNAEQGIAGWEAEVPLCGETRPFYIVENGRCAFYGAITQSCR